MKRRVFFKAIAGLAAAPLAAVLPKPKPKLTYRGVPIVFVEHLDESTDSKHDIPHGISYWLKPPRGRIT